MDENIKDALAKEEKTKLHGLTKSDRILLRAYFRFSKCIQIPSFPVRKKKSACEFIQTLLFPRDNDKDAEKSKRTDRVAGNGQMMESDGNVKNAGSNMEEEKEEEEEEDENEPFDLGTLLENEVPTIFRWDLDALTKLFTEAANFTENQMIAVLRSFTSFDRLYSSDLAISTGFVRLLLVGPVGVKKEESKKKRKKE